MLVATTNYGLWYRLKKTQRVPLITANDHAQLSITAPKKEKAISKLVSTDIPENPVVVKEKKVIEQAQKEFQEKVKRKEENRDAKYKNLFPKEIVHKKKVARGPNPLSVLKKTKKQRTGNEEDEVEEETSSPSSSSASFEFLLPPLTPEQDQKESVSPTLPLSLEQDHQEFETADGLPRTRRKPRKRIRKGVKKRLAIEKAAALAPSLPSPTETQPRVPLSLDSLLPPSDSESS